MVTGIICEYNPLHLGHKKQLDMIRQADPDGAIVCLMSGNFVQRGKPAIVSKAVRAKAAILAGAPRCTKLPLIRQTMAQPSENWRRIMSNCFL